MWDIILRKNYKIWGTVCYFLVAEQESNQRSQHREGVNVALPRAKYTLPYVPIPWRSSDAAQQGTTY
jgi:hypothetical protein